MSMFDLVFLDKRLSFKAKGILFYAFSHSYPSKCNINDLINNSSEERESIECALVELEAFGYLRRVQTRKADGKLGKYEWTFTLTPIKK